MLLPSNMVTRMYTCPRCLRAIARRRAPREFRRYASVEAVTPAPSLEQMAMSTPPIARHHPMQPPSLKPPEFRRTQIHRQYTSMLRSTPMMIFFQHTNLKSNEWVAVRRELAVALRKVDESSKAKGYTDLDLADSIKIQVIQTGVFGAALRVVEYYETEPLKVINALDTAVPTSSELPPSGSPSQAFAIPHALSRSAYEAVEKKKLGQALAPLIVGQLAVLTFPTVSAEHLKAAMSILSPQAPNFPAPKRRTDPGYHDPSVQAGVQKLLLLGARVEGKVFDTEGARWVGSIEGGIDGLRGQLAAMLQSLGAGVTNTLETAGRSLYFTMESRRTMLDEEKGKTETETETDRASDQKQ